jgi:hypothetical protein
MSMSNPQFTDFREKIVKATRQAREGGFSPDEITDALYDLLSSHLALETDDKREALLLVIGRTVDAEFGI